MISEVMTKAQHEAVARAMRNTRSDLAESICWGIFHAQRAGEEINQEELVVAIRTWYESVQDHTDYCFKYIHGRGE